MARLTPPRVRMPRVTRPGRASRAGSDETTATEPSPAANNPSPATKEGDRAQPATAGEQATSADAKPAEKAGETRTAPGPTALAQARDPNLQERIEGLQGWMAELERKQARTSYFGAVAVVIALAAAGVALYFGITNKNDSATKHELDGLSSRVDSLQTAVAKSSKNTQNTINSSIAQLQSSIQALQKQRAQDAANIATLQSQAQSGAFTNKGGAGAAGSTLTPPTVTTTPKKKP